MKRLFNLLQWAVLIAIAIFVAHTLTRPVPPPDYRPATWSSWEGFHAVSYAGVTRDGERDYVTPRRLAEHLQALRHAGYQAIRPVDAAAFLRGQAPLPERAILLLFEGGRKDSLLAATPLLRRFGQVATMCVPTHFTKRWGSFYLHERDLAKLLREPHWTIASMGDQAARLHPVGSGQQGRFLTQRQWSDGQIEEDEDFCERIGRDFAEASRLLDRVSRTNVALYLFPFADAGSSAQADAAAAPCIATALSRHHQIAISRADDAFNGPDSDAFALSRLRVTGAWDADRLLTELERARPRTAGLRAGAGPGAWSLRGAGQATTEALDLGADSLAWLHGSATWSDVNLQAHIQRTAQARAVVYLRYAGPTRYVRLVLDRDGLRLQERLGQTMQTLYQQPHDAPSLDHAIQLRVKGNRAWLAMGDGPATGPLPLTRATDAGRIGFGAEVGPVVIRAVEAIPQPGHFALASRYADIPAEQRDRLTAFLPPWFTGPEAIPLDAAQERDLLAASAEGVEVIPLIAAPPGADANALRSWGDGVEQALHAPLVNSLIRRVAVQGDVPELVGRLHLLGYGVVHVLDADQARAGAARGRAPWPLDTVLVVGNDDALGLLPLLLQKMPASRLAILLENETDLPAGVRVARRY